MPRKICNFAHNACTAILVAIYLLQGAPAEAQELRVRDLEKNVELCNRVADVAPDDRIASCNAVIEAGGQTSQSRVIAYNNSGNAYLKKATSMPRLMSTTRRSESAPTT